MSTWLEDLESFVRQALPQPDVPDMAARQDETVRRLTEAVREQTRLAYAARDTED